LGRFVTRSRVATSVRWGVFGVCAAWVSIAHAQPVAAPGARAASDSLSAALQGYARAAYAGYAEATQGVEALQGAVDSLLAHPSPASLDGARAAWLACRDPYSRTEAFRFAGGPIDDRDGPEPRIKRPRNQPIRRMRIVS